MAQRPRIEHTIGENSLTLNVTEKKNKQENKQIKAVKIWKGRQKFCLNKSVYKSVSY